MIKRFFLFRLFLFVALAIPGFSVQAENGTERLASALRSFDRPMEDKARDSGRKPAEVLIFLGIKPGMQVIDVMAAGGWYSEVLSMAVGAQGKVYAQNPAMMLKFRDGANDKALAKRLAGGRLANVVRWDRELNDLGLEPGSLDAAITALNLHDIYNNSPDAALQMLQAVKTVLKPGGVLGVTDHVGVAGADNKALHRMTLEDAIALAEKAGFQVETSSLLANARDNHDTSPFAPQIRGQTDRFLLKLKKPS